MKARKAVFCPTTLGTGKPPHGHRGSHAWKSKSTQVARSFTPPHDALHRSRAHASLNSLVARPTPLLISPESLALIATQLNSRATTVIHMHSSCRGSNVRVGGAVTDPNTNTGWTVSAHQTNPKHSHAAGFICTSTCPSRGAAYQQVWQKKSPLSDSLSCSPSSVSCKLVHPAGRCAGREPTQECSTNQPINVKDQC